MDSHSIARAYEEFYYAHNCGRPYQREELTVEWALHETRARDTGCL